MRFFRSLGFVRGSPISSQVTSVSPRFQEVGRGSHVIKFVLGMSSQVLSKFSDVLSGSLPFVKVRKDSPRFAEVR